MKERKGETIRKWDHNNVTGDALDWIPTEEQPVIAAGRFQGLRTVPSQFGEGFVMDLDTGKENQTWSVPQILHTKLEGLKPGQPIQINYEGKKKTGSGNIAHQFRVYELDEAEAVALGF